MVFEPLDLTTSLCALVPPPRSHLLRYHGVLAAHAKEQRCCKDWRQARHPPATCGFSGYSLFVSQNLLAYQCPAFVQMPTFFFKHP
ncbi:MAG: transposase [Myxococcales bacterium]|nr:MAG: transposase [Myxococcales bacterium]